MQSMRQQLLRRAVGNRGMLKRGLPQNRYSRAAANVFRRRGLPMSAMPARYGGRSMYFGSRPTASRYFGSSK